MNTGEFIEQRRIAAGLTFWQLAHQLGLNADFVRHLSEGAQLDQLALGTILRLCRLLDIDIDQLLAGRRPARPSEPAADDVKVEAAIVRDGGVATREDLALALKWPLEPLEVALRILERRLQPSGIRLRQTGWNSYAGGVLLLVERRTGAGSHRPILRGGGDGLIHHLLLGSWRVLKEPSSRPVDQGLYAASRLVRRPRPAVREDITPAVAAVS